MQITDRLYTYKIKEKKLDKIITRIKKGKNVPKLVLVTLPLFQDGILEIYDYNQLLQSYYRSIDERITIVGMSKSKSEANELVLNIVQDMYDAGVDFDVREFFGIQG